MQNYPPRQNQSKPFFSAPERRFAKKCLILGITIVAVFFLCCSIDFIYDALRYDMAMTTYEDILNDFVN